MPALIRTGGFEILSLLNIPAGFESEIGAVHTHAPPSSYTAAYPIFAP
jgi:hypothetical protein